MNNKVKFEINLTKSETHRSTSLQSKHTVASHYPGYTDCSMSKSFTCLFMWCTTAPRLCIHIALTLWLLGVVHYIEWAKPGEIQCSIFWQLNSQQVIIATQINWHIFVVVCLIGSCLVNSLFICIGLCVFLSSFFFASLLFAPGRQAHRNEWWTWLLFYFCFHGSFTGPVVCCS